MATLSEEWTEDFEAALEKFNARMRTKYVRKKVKISYIVHGKGHSWEDATIVVKDIQILPYCDQWYFVDEDDVKYSVHPHTEVEVIE
jgi:hypothetical protein